MEEIEVGHAHVDNIDAKRRYISYGRRCEINIWKYRTDRSNASPQIFISQNFIIQSVLNCWLEKIKFESSFAKLHLPRKFYSQPYAHTKWTEKRLRPPPESAKHITKTVYLYSGDSGWLLVFQEQEQLFPAIIFILNLMLLDKKKRRKKRRISPWDA